MDVEHDHPGNASLTADDLEQKHKDELGIVTQVLQVPERWVDMCSCLMYSTAMILLRHFKWNKEKLMEACIDTVSSCHGDHEDQDPVTVCRLAGAVHPSEFEEMQTHGVRDYVVPSCVS